MTQRTREARVLAASLAVALAFFSVGVPAQAESDSATLNGVIRSAAQQPLADARLFAANPKTGEVFPAGPTSDDGNFTLGGLPGGSYQLAVASGEALFLVKKPIYLVPGVARTVQVAIAPDQVLTAEQVAPELEAGPTPSVWNNPLTAAFLVFGIALVVGAAVENLTDDELVTEDESPVK